jgi:DNA polymerase-3 subunit delta
LKITKAALEQMVNSGRDMYYLYHEMERLALCHPGMTITPEELQVVSDLSDYHVFKLIDALMNKRLPLALEALALLLAKGEPPALIVHMISREFVLLGKTLALRKQGMTAGQIAQRLKKPPFRIDKMLSSSYREDTLMQIFSELVATDLKIKNTSQDERLVLENTLVTICEM